MRYDMQNPKARASCRRPGVSWFNPRAVEEGPIFSENEIENFRPKVCFRIAHEVGWACADLDDMVQESLSRFLLAMREQKVRDPAAVGAFLNGICRNVVHEYRRRLLREDAMPEIIPDPADERLSGAEQFEMSDAIAAGLARLSARDREILRAFYIDERSMESILEASGLSYEQFRVVLCRAKERFRAIYTGRVQQRAASRHTKV